MLLCLSVWSFITYLLIKAPSTFYINYLAGNYGICKEFRLEIHAIYCRYSNIKKAESIDPAFDIINWDPLRLKAVRRGPGPNILSPKSCYFDSSINTRRSAFISSSIPQISCCSPGSVIQSSFFRPSILLLISFSIFI